MTRLNRFGSWPPSLSPTRPYPSDLFYAKTDPLSAYVDAILYLGPEPNRNLMGTIPLSPAERAELARRDSLLSDRRRVMQIRYGGREAWFRAHPHDLPERP